MNSTAQRIAVIAILVSLVLPVAFAHSVTMNLRFHITDTSDTIHNDTNYVSAERGGTLAALVFAGTQPIVSSFNTQADPYLFTLSQDETQNRFLVALTNGSWPSIAAKAGKIPATTFSSLPLPEIYNPAFALQFQSDTIDLTGMIAPGQLLVKSLGRARLPIVNLQIVG